MRRPIIYGLVAMTLAGAAHADNGQAFFLQNCSLCHQANAMGLPGQFPRLAGRVSKIAADPKGRQYLIDVLTTGLLGTLQVDGQALTGVMPPFSTLSDATVAEILSYVAALGDTPAPPFTEAEVNAGRKLSKDMEKTQAERQSLKTEKVIE